MTPRRGAVGAGPWGPRPGTVPSLGAGSVRGGDFRWPVHGLAWLCAAAPHPESSSLPPGTECHGPGDGKEPRESPDPSGGGGRRSWSLDRPAPPRGPPRHRRLSSQEPVAPAGARAPQRGRHHPFLAGPSASGAWLVVLLTLGDVATVRVPAEELNNPTSGRSPRSRGSLRHRTGPPPRCRRSLCSFRPLPSRFTCFPARLSLSDLCPLPREWCHTSSSVWFTSLRDALEIITSSQMADFVFSDFLCG